MDWFSYTDWENTAKSDEDMAALVTAADLCLGKQTNAVLATWVKRMDSKDHKPRVGGFGVMDTSTGEVTLLINDVETGIEEAWQLSARPCRINAAANSPQLLATNAEL